MIESDRIVTASASEAEEKQDWAIRPQTFDEYCGQNEVSEQMRLFIRAALGRDEALDHTLIFGPPGLGKTTLANIIANVGHAACWCCCAGALLLQCLHLGGGVAASAAEVQEAHLEAQQLHQLVGGGGAHFRHDREEVHRHAALRAGRGAGAAPAAAPGPSELLSLIHI